jgi:hypothetical protein
MEPASNPNMFDLQIDQSGLNFLGETARWTKFLSILGFIFCGLMALGALFLGSYMSGMMSNLYGTTGMFGGAFFTIIYLLVALLLFFPTLYLYNFSSRMSKALRGNDQVSLTESFKNLKSYFKFHGVLAIIGISLYGLIIIAAVIGAMVGHR